MSRAASEFALPPARAGHELRLLQTLRKALLFLWIVLLPFQDTSLRGTPLRQFGASLSSVPLLLFTLVLILEWALQRRPRIKLAIIAVVAYILLITSVSLFRWGFESYGINLIAKSFNLSILTLLFFVPVFFIDYEERKLLKTAVVIAFCVAALGVLIGDVKPFGLGGLVDNSFFHYTENPDLRPRGFNSESSNLSIQIITLGMAAVHLVDRKAMKGLLLLATLSLLVFSESKGGLLSLILGIGIVMLFRFWRRKIVVRELLAAATLGIGLTAIAIQKLMESFTETIITETSTVATRGSMIIWAFITFLHNPLGVGYSGFLPAIRAYLPAAVAASNRFWLPLNFDEVMAYLSSSENVTAKSFLFNFLVYFGLPFLVFFGWLIFTLVRGLNQCGKTALLFAVVVTAIALCTYIDGITTYSIPLLFGIALHEIRRTGGHDNRERSSLPA